LAESSDFLILGAGIAGLATASALGDRAIVLEKSDRPGGLVITERFGDYWFDKVLHILYFPDEPTESIIKKLLDGNLAPCKPEAWVDTLSGTARFPIQFHLGALDNETVVSALLEISRLSNAPLPQNERNFRSMLETTFGPTLCREFFFPYNNKLWKRDLSSLATDEFTWNIEPTSLEKALRSVLEPDTVFDGYNSRAYYPRPAAGSKIRGMEVLTHCLAKNVPEIRLNSEIVEIDLDAKTVTAKIGNGIEKYKFTDTLISTIPLPVFLKLCRQTPVSLRKRLKKLTCNRVINIALSIEGERPAGTGYWRYNSLEDIIFNRLIFMHEFDPMLAPPDGWGVMAEIVEPSESPIRDAKMLTDTVIEDIKRTGFLNKNHRIIDSNLLIADPAYVVFSLENRQVLSDARNFLDENGVVMIGRYGRWTYSSMGQVLSESNRIASEIKTGKFRTTARPGQAESRYNVHRPRVKHP